MKRLAGHIVKSLVLIFLLSASLASTQDPWVERVSGGNVVTDDGNQICIDSMKSGVGYETRNRAYGLSRDYTVSFDFKLETDNNHWLILYFDEFIYLGVGWGTDLQHWQPGMAYSVSNVLLKLEVGRWYQFKIDARPSRKSFDVYLDGRKVGTAINVEPGRRVAGQPSLQDVAEGGILIGDQETTDYNRGRGCWKNFSLPSGGGAAGLPVARGDKTPILDGVWNFEGRSEIEARHEEFGSWVFKTKPKILIAEWWVDFEMRNFGHKAQKTVTYDLSWTGTGSGFVAVSVDEKGGKSFIEAEWTEQVNLKGRFYDLKPGQSVPDPENPVVFHARRVSDDPRTGGR